MSAKTDSLSDDEPMTFNLKGMPLNKALILMLGTKNATYIIDEGVVVIISLDDAEDSKYLRLKVFDCDDDDLFDFDDDELQLEEDSILEPKAALKMIANLYKLPNIGADRRLHDILFIINKGC